MGAWRATSPTTRNATPARSSSRPRNWRGRRARSSSTDGALVQVLSEAADEVKGFNFDAARLSLDAASGAIEQIREKLDELERGQG